MKCPTCGVDSKKLVEFLQTIEKLRRTIRRIDDPLRKLQQKLDQIEKQAEKVTE